MVVSDGVSCVVTDMNGCYRMRRDSHARFVFYTVPSWCQVPTHSATDRTAYFYQPLVKRRRQYNFTLTRLPNGKKMSIP